MNEDDRSESLRDNIQELREEAASLVAKVKKAARQAEDLTERIKLLENQ
jgi:hypothetical protein